MVLWIFRLWRAVLPIKNRNNESYRLRRSFGIEKAQNVPIREQIL